MPRASLLLVAGLLLVLPILSVHANLDTAVGMWTFDQEGSDVAVDLSENGNDAVYEGDPEWVDGVFGKAISFNGVNGAAQIDDNETIDFDGEEITITSWFWWEGSGDGWQTFVAKGTCCDNPAENYGYFINTGGAHTHFAVSPNGIRGTHNSAQALFKAEEWHFVAVTYDGSTVISYFDGEVSAEAAAAGEMTPNDNPLRIGHREASSHWWKGYLDEVAIFRAALTEDEINLIMNDGLVAAMAVQPQDKLTVTWGQLKQK